MSFAKASAMAAPAEEARRVRRELDGAGDEQIARVVALVDGMVDRGAADALIAPLRPRLAQLRPRRAPNFGRVLFAPLDPVIQPAPTWRRGTLGIPRTVLPCLAAEVRAAIPAEAVAVEDMLRAAQMEPRRATASAGRRLWSISAGILRALPMPQSWARDTGLGAADFAAIGSGCAAVLEAATEIEDLAAELSCGNDPEPAALQRLIGRASGHGPFEAGLLMAVMLARIPATAAILDAAVETARLQPSSAAAAAVEQAVEFHLVALDGAAEARCDVAEAAAHASRAASLLDALEQPGPSFRPSRKARTEALRRKVDGACRTRIKAELDGRLAGANTLAKDATDAQVIELETALRALRRYEGAARNLGGGEHYDKLLRGAGAQAAALPLPLADRVRLVEMLLGSEQAMALFGRS